MRVIYFTLFLMILMGSCFVPQIALDIPQQVTKEMLPVKGRNGFLLKQRLSFGSFATGNVKRSWTRGSSWGVGNGTFDWVDQVRVDFVNRKQTLRFSLTDGAGRLSQVSAVAKAGWVDLTLGRNPASLLNIIGDMLQMRDVGSSVYAVRIATDQQGLRWEMVIDNNAAQLNARNYIGLLARSKTDFYHVAPVYKLLNKQGKAVALPFGGSVGFEFRRPDGTVVAAVSLIERGTVYFMTDSPEEKFLLANAAAALLLQQQLEA